MPELQISLHLNEVFVQTWLTATDVGAMSEQAHRANGAEIPLPPGKLSELGVPPSLVEDLFIRRLLNERMSTVHAVSTALGIQTSIGREITEDLRERHVLEYHGMEGRDYRIGLTDNGTKIANDRMRQSSYASYVPICLAEYTARVASQKANTQITQESIRRAFGDLVVEDDLLDQLGPAFLSDGAIFLYGPPGTGKTSLAERMIRIHEDHIYVPRCLEVDGQIISVFDQSVHEPVANQPEDLDPRWVLCNRPLVIVGGELTMQMLDLDFDPSSGTYTAPIQMQANNGILVVDDFGRQQISPGELLNRWIVPLSRDIDFLKLASGTKFTVPFELKLVASTNLDPSDLGDDAFLRRLRNKVYVGPITENAFNWILVRVAQAKGIEVTAEAAAHLRSVAVDNIGELRPYIAVDFLEMMMGIASYENRALVLDNYMIDRVARVYFFVDETDSEEPMFAETILNEQVQVAQPVQAEQSDVQALVNVPVAVSDATLPV